MVTRFAQHVRTIVKAAEAQTSSGRPLRVVETYAAVSW
jgi:hypothetical protein